MKNYLEELYPVTQFMHECTSLAENARHALDTRKSFYPNGEDEAFVVIEVERYHCIAYLIDSFSPYVLAETITRSTRIVSIPFKNLSQIIRSNVIKEINYE